MAKKQTPQQHTQARIARTEAYAEKVRRLFAYTVNQICEMNKRMPDIDNGIMYSFDGDSKKVQQEVETLLRQLHAVTTAAIKQGIELEWEQANEECDKLVQSCFGREVLKDPMFDAYTTHNERAMNAFIARSERGLNLSDRVWKSVRQLRDEMEVAITVSVGEGASAQQMSRRVRQYLDDPDLMFRRFRYKIGEEDVKDDNGKVIGKKPVYGRKWKKRIKKDDGTYGWIDYDRDSYRTGAGVYKSSAKNAMRVARTETNIAYRRSDNERWQQMDFVLGQRIQLSKKHPKADICDDLQGDYPVEFVFEGWHPQCFCFVTPILMDAAEMRKARQARLRGETYTPRGKRVTDYPQAFKDWVSENADKIALSHDVGQDSYFVRHNYDIVQRILNPTAEPTLFEKQTEQIDKLQQYLQDGYLPKKTAATLDKLRSLAEAGDDAAAAEFERRATLLQTAAERHAARTHEKIADIKQRWQERNEFNAQEQQLENLLQQASGLQGASIDTDALKAARKTYNVSVVKSFVDKIKKLLGNQQTLQTQQQTTFVYDKLKDPNFVYVQDSTKLTYQERVNNIIDALEKCDPKKAAYVAVVRDINKNETIAKYLWKKISNYRSKDYIRVYECVTHWNELLTADLSKVPKQWQKTLNDLIKKINAHDISKGFFEIYNEIEYAYNIYKLATTQAAVSYGLDKLSDKTPYNLFTSVRKKIPDFTLPKKEFFDRFDRFVPLMTTGSGAYYSPKFRHVCISMSDSDNLLRLRTSKWYQDGLLHHEFGHALDPQKKMCSDAKLIKIYDDWKAEVLKDNGKSLEAAIEAILKPMRKDFDDWWNASDEKKKADKAVALAKTFAEIKKAIQQRTKLRHQMYAEKCYDLEEQIGALSDCLGAALDGKRFIQPRGHLGGYFSSKDMQLAEFIAHCSENYWSGNPYFKQLAPQLYKLMSDYIRDIK
jgi:hypothetical protein